ncbi:hypothetical protein NDU88_001804 [Pleurodeles waltl]|uniref:Uncharacterized protein n=1 Tax=Pleurodeles waltl TaxID=8319 RepID=A0AAV7KQJ3_PLEWA|nr:hypothetical protein NDU88_001804 [Pleurodeles waltl]
MLSSNPRNHVTVVRNLPSYSGTCLMLSAAAILVWEGPTRLSALPPYLSGAPVPLAPCAAFIPGEHSLSVMLLPRWDHIGSPQHQARLTHVGRGQAGDNGGRELSELRVSPGSSGGTRGLEAGGALLKEVLGCCGAPGCGGTECRLPRTVPSGVGPGPRGSAASLARVNAGVDLLRRVSTAPWGIPRGPVWRGLLGEQCHIRSETEPEEFRGRRWGEPASRTGR